MSLSRPIEASINLSALKKNISSLLTDVDVKALAVVKANAYGHGAVECSIAALEAGCSYLGVASLDEALELRNANIKAPILVFGFVDLYFIDVVLKNNITLTIFDMHYLKLLLGKISDNEKLTIHLKVDTGLGRLGFNGESLIAALKELKNHSNIFVEGLFTHFSCPDTLEEKELNYTNSQIAFFDNSIRQLKNLELCPKLIHASSSGATLSYINARYNMVRLGIGMYGYFPSQSLASFYSNIDLQPAMTVKSKIISLKDMPISSWISYGGKHICKNNSKIAVIPFGYADGLRRDATGSNVLIHNCLAPIVGSICMDMCMIDVSHIPNVTIYDEVIIFGDKQSFGKLCPTAEDFAKNSKTISYEILSQISNRVPRLYF